MTERKHKKQPAAKYEVGYAKPPVEHQFKKGQRRPPRKPKEDKPPPSFEDYLEAELAEPMRITENGVELTVPKGKALAKASIKGAMDDKDPRRLKPFLRPARAQEDFDFSEVNLTIVARFMEAMLKQSQPPPDAPRDNDPDEGADYDHAGDDDDVDEEDAA